MHLHTRKIENKDLGECLALMQGGYLYDQEARIALQQFWSDLLGRSSGESVVVEDVARPQGQRVRAFGFSVFVTDQFAAEMKHMISLPVGLQLLRLWRSGNSPILEDHKRRQQDSDQGLNVVIPYNGWHIDPCFPDDGLNAYMKINDAFLVMHRGYRLKECLVDMYGETEVRHAEAAGFRILTNYASFLEKEELACLARDLRPFLMGVSRAEASTQTGSYAYAMFLHSAPRLGLTPAEKLLLEHALLGKTDEAIAQSLWLALSTIKTRWKMIYVRVEERIPELLPSADEISPSSTGRSKRGNEKRRHLLNYLRDHLEELRS